MSNAVIISELPVDLTEQLAKLISECLQKCLHVTEKVTIDNQEFPHKFEALIEWIRLGVRKNNSLMPGICAIRINSTIHVLKENEKKTIRGYCESFQFDLSDVSKVGIEDNLWDSIVKIIRQVHMETLSQAMKNS